jgi:hypothetical protein
MTRSWRALQGILMLIILVGATNFSARAQTVQTPKPVDTMLVIDQSCSMFAASLSIPGCDTYGSDPDKLRIAGSDLLIGRLGLGAPNEEDYRMGAITLGDKPVLVSPLVSLKTNRDALAAKISTSQIQTATRLVPALQMAYDALKDSPQATPARVPAIVVVTDSVPSPKEGQSTDDIEKLVGAHSDVPLFVILLKNSNLSNADFESYINFWQKLESQYPLIFTYQINDPAQILSVYHQILGQLQGGIPEKTVSLDKTGKTTFTVPDLVQNIVVMGIRPAAKSTAVLTVTDPDGKKVDAKDAGVLYFRGKDNPIEIYSIPASRLAVTATGGAWTVTSSDKVTVLIDHTGSYQFAFLAPTVQSVVLPFQSQAVERQYSNSGIVLRFQLVDRGAKTVLDAQRIQVTISNQSGKTIDLPLTTLKPDASGVYELPVDLPTLFPASDDPSGQYKFSFSSRSAGQDANISPLLASAELSLSLGKIPGIRSVSPIPIYCRTGQPASLQVVIKDIDPLIQNSIQVQVSNQGKTYALQPDGTGQFTGDVSALCQDLIIQSSCSSISTTSLQVDLVVGQTSQAAAIPQLSRPIDANVIAPACTITPQPSITPTPTPGPTPVPDRDHDGTDDLHDKCPTTWGWPQAGGCIPWTTFVGGGGLFVILGMAATWVWPWMKTNRISPAPSVYVVACRDGVKMFEPVAIDQVSRKQRHSRLLVGGASRKVDIMVEGLQPVEYVIEWWGGVATLREPGDKEPLAYFDATPRSVRTSDPKIILRIGTDPKTLSCA